MEKDEFIKVFVNKHLDQFKEIASQNIEELTKIIDQDEALKTKPIFSLACVMDIQKQIIDQMNLFCYLFEGTLH